MVDASISREDKDLRRARALLERAEHPNTPPAEAEAAYAQANKLMLKHAFNEALLRASLTESERRKPVRIDIEYYESSMYEFSSYLRTILEGISRANRCRHVVVEGKMAIIGFQDDVSWVETLFTTTYYAFLSQMKPSWKPEIGYDANVYNFKVSGYKWKQINQIAIKAGQPDMENKKVHTRYSYDTHQMEEVEVGTGFYHKMLAAYRRHAKVIGDTTPVATQNFEAYRLSYAQEFSRRINARLEQMVEDNKKETESSGMELVLFDIMAAVNEFFWGQFPNLSPTEMEARAKARREQEEREAEARRLMLEGMTPAQRKRFIEDEQKEERRKAREYDRWYRDHYRTIRYDNTGGARGAAAADEVRLSRSGSPVSTTTRKELS